MVHYIWGVEVHDGSSCLRALYHRPEDFQDIEVNQVRTSMRQSTRDTLNHPLFHIGDLLDIIIMYSEPPKEHMYLMNEFDIMYKEWEFCHAQFSFAKWYLSVARYFREITDSFANNSDYNSDDN